MKPIVQSKDSFFPCAPSNLLYMEDSFNGNSYITSGCFHADCPDRTIKHLAWVGCVIADFDLCDYIHHILPENRRAHLQAKYPDKKLKEAIKAWMYELFATKPEKVAEIRAKHQTIIADALATAGLPAPTVLSDSGWGHHAIWWLSEPASTPEAIKEARSKNAAIVAALNAAAGFDLADPGVHDAGTRLLREHNAVNVKSPQSPRTVVPFQMTPDARLDLKALQVQVGPAATKPASVPNKLSSTPSSLPSSVVDCFNANPRIRDLYDGKGKDQGDKSGSGYSFSLCVALLSKGISTEDAQAAVYVRDIGRGKSHTQAERSAYRITLKAADKVSSGRANQAKRKDLPTEIKAVVDQLETKENGDICYTLQNTIKLLGLDSNTRGSIYMDSRMVCPCMSSQAKQAIGIVGTPPEQLKDTDLIQLRYYFSVKYGYEPSKLMIQEATDCVAEMNPRNTLKEYLEAAVSGWDRTFRIDTWLIRATGVADTPLMRAYSRKFLISAVARAFEPGCKVDTMLVLKGGQGCGKSTLVEVIAGKGNSSCSKLNIGDKDALLQIHRTWLYEVAEMVSISKKEAGEVKEFLTTAVDNFRAPYERASINHPRPCVFVGTTNKDTFLLDPTGSRRYWPVTCGEKIDLDWVAANRDQLWGEATEAYMRKEKWWLDATEVALHAEDAHQYEVEDPRVQHILEFLSKLHSTAQFSIADVQAHLEIPKGDLHRSRTEIGDLLKSLGCVRVGQKRTGTVRTIVWGPPPSVALPENGVIDLDEA